MIVGMGAGCETAAPVAPVASSAAVAEASSYLTVSSDAPAVGAVVTVIGNADRAGGTAYGSFTAHLVYDQSRLEFVEEFALGGGMRALHHAPGVVTIAGAAAGTAGFSDGRLFAVRFRVLAPVPYTAMAMQMDELNGVDFAPQLHRSRPRTSIALDASIR